MPKTRITEIDATGVLQQSSISNTIFVPVLVTDAFKPTLVWSQSELETAFGVNPKDSFGYRICKHLLNIGFPVLVQGVTSAMTDSDWEALKDKGLYDIRFLTNGVFRTIPAKMIDCAESRGDCIALCDTDESEPAAGQTQTWMQKIRTAFENATGETAVGSNFAAGFVPAFYSKNADLIGTTTNWYQLTVTQPEDWATATTSYFVRHPYELLETEPADWSTAATNYYLRETDGSTHKYTFTNVTAGTAWAANTYYKKVDHEVYMAVAAETTWETGLYYKFIPGTTTTIATVPAAFGYLFAYANSAKNNNAEWLAIAGYERGVIPELSGVTRELSAAEIEVLQARATTAEVELDAATDNIGIAINPIANIRPAGYIIYGNRTLHKNESPKKTIASSFLNIRNLVSAVKKNLYDAANLYRFEQNDEILWINFQAYTTPLLDKMKTGNGIKGYKWIRQTTNAKARLKARLVLVPIEAVEDFDLEVYLTDNLNVTE